MIKIVHIYECIFLELGDSTDSFTITIVFLLFMNDINISHYQDC